MEKTWAATSRILWAHAAIQHANFKVFFTEDNTSFQQDLMLPSYIYKKWFIHYLYFQQVQASYSEHTHFSRRT